MNANPIDLLPEAPLTDAGPACARFMSKGVQTFRAACAWVRDAPYGQNSGQYPHVLFDEGHGTCRSKHALIAVLAREIDLPVSQYVGAYRLDESIVEGAGAVLAAQGLTYVPQMHCVLKYHEQFVDLTAGNCHGKRRDVTDMDVYFRVDPLMSDSEYRAAYALGVQYYQWTDPVLARKSFEEIHRIARACSAKARMACAV